MYSCEKKEEKSVKYLFLSLFFLYKGKSLVFGKLLMDKMEKLKKKCIFIKKTIFVFVKETFNTKYINKFTNS